jgi:hypothetical protein
MLQYRIPAKEDPPAFWDVKEAVIKLSEEHYSKEHNPEGSQRREKTFWFETDTLGRPVLSFHKDTTQEYREKTKKEVFDELSKASLLKEREVLCFTLKNLNCESEYHKKIEEIQGIVRLKPFYPNTKLPRLKIYFCAIIEVSEMENVEKSLEGLDFIVPDSIFLVNDMPERSLINPM